MFATLKLEVGRPRWGPTHRPPVLHPPTPVHSLYKAATLCDWPVPPPPPGLQVPQRPHTHITQEETDLSHSTYTPSKGGEKAPERAAEMWADNMQNWLRKHTVPDSHVFTRQQGLCWEVGMQP